MCIVLDYILTLKIQLDILGEKEGSWIWTEYETISGISDENDVVM